MKSPITGKEMTLAKEKRYADFRKENYTYTHHSYICEESGEHFTTNELDEINTNQVYNQYRENHNLPFPEEILAIRERYGLSASKMSEILGFGINVYRNYEGGEVPSESNARLIQLAKNPNQFKNLIELNVNISDESRQKYIVHIDNIIKSEHSDTKNLFEKLLLDFSSPNQFTGFKLPKLNVFIEMIKFFTEEVRPYKTKLNKLLFYSDFLCFKNTGSSISGMTYYAIDLGPVPNNFNSLFEHAIRSGEINLKSTQFDNGTGEQFLPIPNSPCKKDNFTQPELACLQEVLKRFGDTTTSDIIEISHMEPAWIENFSEGKSMISYQKYGFNIIAI